MSKVALVTGANQGLGFAMLKDLANRLTSDDVVYLGARNRERGIAALESLGQTIARVEVVHLDVTLLESISSMVEMLTNRHGGIDVIVSNAAARISKDTPQSEQVQAFIETNNHGSKALFEALMPILNWGARYVMVASSFGQLRSLPIHLHPLFDTDTLSLDDIETSMDIYVQEVQAGTALENGWSDWINIPSKIGQVATARVAARIINETRKDEGILLNAVCPGLVDTDASRPWFDNMIDAKSPDEAAHPIVDLLMTKVGEVAPHGQLVTFGKVLPWL